MPDTALAGLGRVTADTRSKAAEVLLALESQTPHRLTTLYGFNPASKPEHSVGRAVDFMCTKEAGDWIADYLWARRDRLRLRWVLWQRRIRSTTAGKPTTWQPMADRGSVTQNHEDHVHAFFDDGYTPPQGGGPAAPTLPITPPAAGPGEPWATDATRDWWGADPPQAPAFLSVPCLRAAMLHDTGRGDQRLGYYADQVAELQRMLLDLGWLRPGSIRLGHYGTLTRGGVMGFQAKRGHAPDGWPGVQELTMMVEWTKRRIEVRP